MLGFELREYVDAKGDCLFRKWLLSIKDIKTRARIRARLDRLKLGNFGDTRSVGSGVCELRIHFGSGYRVYYALVESKSILLLCGGDKCSQRIDVKQAKRYLADFKSEI